MFDGVSRSEMAAVVLFTVALYGWYYWMFYGGSDTAKRLKQLHELSYMTISADKKVETQVIRVEQLQRSNDRRIQEAARRAADTVRNLDAAGVCDGLRSELAWIRGRDRYGNLGAGRERGTHPASRKGPAAGNPGATRRERRAALLALIRTSSYSRAGSLSAGSAGTDTAGTPAFAGNDSAAPETAERGETEDKDGGAHRRYRGDSGACDMRLESTCEAAIAEAQLGMHRWL